MEDNILEIKDVSKLYPGVTALNHINLTFRKGEIHALCGENGAGKSTLIKTISGAITPTAGQIIIDGETPGKRLFAFNDSRQSDQTERVLLQPSVSLLSPFKSAGLRGMRYLDAKGELLWRMI